MAGHAEVPPVPTITTVGPQVEVWITYFATRFMAYRFKFQDTQQFHGYKEGYIMQCVWTGDMTEPHDILKFRLILENTYTWAIRVFKPLMATYINQWSFAYPVDSPSLASMTRARQQDKLELTRSTVQSIQRALDPQIDPSAGRDWHRGVSMRLRELCKTFAQDVDRMIEEELESSRRSTRAASKEVRGSKGAAQFNSDGPTNTEHEGLQPRQSENPDYASMALLSAPRSMSPSEASGAVEVVSSYLKASMAIWNSWGTQETAKPESTSRTAS
ncbi:hypothetical protein H9Q72_002824 [Fusarium xylarioides]|uniref:Uncharacterized protein n=1 Tax=Fusarium xylarioides TaxID=221167 RepID=A0A9P7HZ27_9HYPO|nr:hypothetical protein H9Q70_000955 [Fusarium xylarioides]KAG5770250.1 hypothetical protein H9Q72_002824 [Fusarium xylarioides]KAG5785847.1 hypothetical protein H9Q73_000574 [Fusarium xylarioides]